MTPTARAGRKEGKMTTEQILKLADKYADQECAMSKLADKTQLREDKILEFIEVSGFLCEHCCIAEKDKVEEEYHEAKFACGNVDPCSETWATYLAQKSLLERLFPEITIPDLLMPTDHNHVKLD